VPPSFILAAEVKKYFPSDGAVNLSEANALSVSKTSSSNVILVQPPLLNPV